MNIYKPARTECKHGFQIQLKDIEQVLQDRLVTHVSSKEISPLTEYQEDYLEACVTRLKSTKRTKVDRQMIMSSAIIKTQNQMILNET